MSIRQIPWSVLQRIDGMRGGRFYEGPEGQRLPSVTNILSVIAKPALVNWAANTERALVIEAAANLYTDLPSDPRVPRMKRDAYVRTLEQRIGAEKAHQRISRQAADVGSQVHKLIEWNLRRELGQHAGPEPRVDQAAGVAFAAFLQWWRASGLRAVRIEQMIFHPGKLYAGTLDVLAVDERDRVGIVDFKTSKAIYLEYVLQVGGAYAPAVDAMGHGPVEWAKIARFPKTETEPAFDVTRDIHDVVLLPELHEVFCHALQLFNWLQANDTYQKQESPKKRSAAAPDTRAAGNGVTAGSGAEGMAAAVPGDRGGSQPAVTVERGAGENDAASGKTEASVTAEQAASHVGGSTHLQGGRQSQRPGPIPLAGEDSALQAATPAPLTMDICEAASWLNKRDRLLREAGITAARDQRAKVFEVLGIERLAGRLSDEQNREFCQKFEPESKRLAAQLAAGKKEAAASRRKAKKGVAA